MQRVRLTIDGMHCGGCVCRVAGILRSVPGVGVEGVAVGAARLRLDADQVSPATVVNALSANGFPAREEVPDDRR